MQKNIWYCPVCGYEQESEFPPKECPQCSSKEFIIKSEKQKIKYQNERLDVLIINGSTHASHNTGYLVSVAEQELKNKKLKFKIFNLNQIQINHCWCCYSMYDSACTYPCRNQLDDASELHKYILNSKAILIFSPINWNNMSARLKDFIDRLTCIQNQPLINKPSMTSGKLFGVVINGHEDGAMKTSWDIFFPFQQMGYIMIPYGIAYRTHGAYYNTIKDNDFLKKDKKIESEIKGMIHNLNEMLKLNIEKKVNKKIKPVCE